MEPPTLLRPKFSDENEYQPIKVTSDRVDAMIESYRQPCPSYTPVFYPFHDVELYIFMVGLKGADADAIREKYPPLAPIDNKPLRVKNKYNVPDDPDWVRSFVPWHKTSC